MNIINRKLIALSFVAASVLGVSAQESATGYFMDNYYLRWQMNPAMANRNNYVGFPGLGNLNISANGNFSPTDIVYSHGGKTVLFTHPGISADEVLDNLKNVNRFSSSSNIGFLQGGFEAFGGYNNVAINVRQQSDLALPKSIFSLLKEGIGNNAYDIKDLHAKVSAYAEIVFNHSRDIKQVPGLRAGASLKLMLPVGFMDANFNELALQLGEDNWKAQSDARLRMALKGMRYKTKINDRTGKSYVSGIDGDDYKFGFNGFGFGIDLGATYEWNEFKFSAAFTDLGMISFNSVQEASTNGVKKFETADHVIGIGDHGDSWDQLVDDLSPLYELHDNGDIGSSSVALLGKFREGVDYQIPLYDRLHFGLMNTTDLSTMFTAT